MNHIPSSTLPGTRLHRHHLRGIIFMFLGVSALSLMDAAVKTTLHLDIPVLEIIAIRGWIITAVLLLAIPFKGGWHCLSTGKIKLHIGRTVVGFFAPFLFFSSLKFLPLADATAIFFCTTFFMTAGSMFFLGEQVGIHRWSAVIVGFIGVLVVSSPGSGSFQAGALLALLAGAAYAVIMLSGRLLTRTDSSFKMVFFFNAINSLISTALLPMVWTPPSQTASLLILLTSALALIGYFCITHAIRLSPIGVVAPIEYISLVWATVLGYVFWEDIPTMSVWVGMAIILSAGLYIMWRESRHSTAAA